MVEKDGRPLGLLTLSNLNAIPRQDWSATNASQAMTPVDKFHLLKSDSGLSDALVEMNLEGVDQLPVITDGQVQGILSRESVTSFLRTLQELKGSRS